MANVFTTIGELIEDLLTSHIDPKKIDQIIANEATIIEGQLVITKALADEKTARETMQADLLSIKVFLGVPDVRVGATQEQLDAFGKRITDETAVVQQSDANIPPTAT
jgi:hypothetical protein